MHQRLQRRVEALEASQQSGRLAVVFADEGEDEVPLEERVRAAQRALALDGIVVVWDL
jgi:uncharacterized protein YheU (UPF0270 family)